MASSGCSVGRIERYLDGERVGAGQGFRDKNVIGCMS